jgi:hypothetical protein
MLRPESWSIRLPKKRRFMSECRRRGSFLARSFSLLRVLVILTPDGLTMTIVSERRRRRCDFWIRLFGHNRTLFWCRQ